MEWLGVIGIAVLAGCGVVAWFVGKRWRPRQKLTPPITSGPATPLPMAAESRAAFCARCVGSVRMQELYPDSTARMQACDGIYSLHRGSGA